MVSGMLAGIGASVVTHPFDVIKTRRMASSGPRMAGLAGAPPGSLPEGTIQLVRAAVAEEGVAALFKGLVRIPPSKHFTQ